MWLLLNFSSIKPPVTRNVHVFREIAKFEIGFSEVDREEFDPSVLERREG